MQEVIKQNKLEQVIQLLSVRNSQECKNQITLGFCLSFIKHAVIHATFPYTLTPFLS